MEGGNAACTGQHYNLHFCVKVQDRLTACFVMFGCTCTALAVTIHGMICTTSETVSYELDICTLGGEGGRTTNAK